MVTLSPHIFQYFAIVVRGASSLFCQNKVCELSHFRFLGQNLQYQYKQFVRLNTSIFAQPWRTPFSTFNQNTRHLEKHFSHCMPHHFIRSHICRQRGEASLNRYTNHFTCLFFTQRSSSSAIRSSSTPCTCYFKIGLL